MSTTDRFTSLEEVHALRQSLKAERDAREEDLRAHWRNFKDKEFRRALLLDAASDLFTHKNALSTLAEGVKLSGGWLPLIGPLLGGRKGLLGNRLFWSGLSVALPFLVKKDGGTRVAELWEGVRNGFQHLKDLVRARNGVHADQE